MVRSTSWRLAAGMDCPRRTRRSRSQGWNCAHWRPAGRDHAGLTLIELLIVIAIIMILISLLLSGMSGARDAARTASCLSNQKQIHTAMTSYANASRDYVPREGTFVVEGRNVQEQRLRLPWNVALRPFMDDRVGVDEDPNDLFERAPFYRDPGRRKDGHQVHYVTNAVPMASKGMVDTGARTNYWRRRGPMPMGRMNFASQTIYLAEFSDDAEQLVWNALQTQTREDLHWGQPYDIWDILHLEPSSSQYRVGGNRHGGGGNAVFLDGHALTMKKADLLNVDNWDDRYYGVRDEAPSIFRQ